MTNPILRAGERAFEVAMYGVGLAAGAGQAVVRRALGSEGSRASAPTPQAPPDETVRHLTQPREVPTPAPPPPSSPTARMDDLDVVTPVGTTGAAPGYNPSTAESDLQQPGTEEIVDPSTTKKVKSESDMLRKAAERNPE